jgi:hypothetical protein
VLALVPIQKTAAENAVISHAPVPPTAQRTAELQGEECEVLDEMWQAHRDGWHSVELRYDREPRIAGGAECRAVRRLIARCRTGRAA